jgi:hypothetical protein
VLEEKVLHGGVGGKRSFTWGVRVM